MENVFYGGGCDGRLFVCLLFYFFFCVLVDVGVLDVYGVDFVVGELLYLVDEFGL